MATVRSFWDTHHTALTPPMKCRGSLGLLGITQMALSVVVVAANEGRSSCFQCRSGRAIGKHATNLLEKNNNNMMLLCFGFLIPMHTGSSLYITKYIYRFIFNNAMLRKVSYINQKYRMYIFANQHLLYFIHQAAILYH